MKLNRHRPTNADTIVRGEMIEDMKKKKKKKKKNGYLAK